MNNTQSGVRTLAEVCRPATTDAAMIATGNRLQSAGPALAQWMWKSWCKQTQSDKFLRELQ
jgi:hypothetical protein